MPPRSPPVSPESDAAPRTAAVGLALLTLAAGALHILVQSGRPLWHDEACTYWTIQASAFDLVHGARTDGTPPLYFLLVHAASVVLGSSEWALRAVSMVAATALVPLCYAVVRTFAPRRAALVVAALAVASPLVHYYAIEARNYAVLQLETAAVLYAVMRAVRQPTAWRWWALVSAMLALQLWTHGYAVFIAASLPVACVIAASANRIQTGLRAAAAVGVAALAAAPALIGAWRQSGSGVADWIVDVWAQTPPAAAILRSIEVFGFGGLYPRNLTWLGVVPTVRWLSIGLTAGVMAVAINLAVTRGTRRADQTGPVKLLLSFLLLPLLAAWCYSMVRQPLYVVGRYDTLVLPAFLMLMGLGLNAAWRWRRWLGAAAGATVLAFAFEAETVVGHMHVFTDDQGLKTAEYLDHAAAESDPIVSMGFRRAVVAYYLDRAHHHATIDSFPSEEAGHPGWYSSERLLSNRTALAQDADHLAAELIEHARAGGKVWILTSTFAEVDEFLYRDLEGVLRVDEADSRPDLQIVCLTLK